MLKGMTTAEKECIAAGADFTSLFKYQFLLSKNPDLRLPGFSIQRLGSDWTLYSGSALPLTPILDSRQRAVGWVLGAALHPDGGLIESSLNLAVSNSEKSFLSKAEGLIEGLAGRYIVMITSGTKARIYIDPVSALGAVYDPKTRTVASTVLLALDRDREPNPLFDEELIFAGRGNYTLQHTSDAGLRRLLPNHYLDLSDFTHCRHWPKEGQEFHIPLEEAPAALEEIRDRLARTMRTLVSARPCVMPISAGRDSRNLVAAGRDHLDQVSEFFAFGHHFNSRLDCAVGSLVAEKMGLPYHIYDVDDFPKTALNGRFKRRVATRDYMIANGMTGTPPNEVVYGLIRHQPPGLWHIRGNVMDLMQASHWKNGAITPETHDPEHGIKRLLITGGSGNSDELSERWMPHYLEWYETLGSLKTKPYDMIFNELYLASSQGGKMYGLTHHFYISPFNDRYLIERAISLPLQYRITDRANDDLLAISAPELSKIPFLRAFQYRAKERGGNWYGKTMVRIGERLTREGGSASQ